ncbi:MAG: DUF547 domain-containing protein [Gammaproteobacteria bacterium]|nr:MAG: DUF547 domain-containing protein [Gammaproteobacteria bacterium]
MKSIDMQKISMFWIVVLLAMAPNLSHADSVGFNRLYGELLTRYWRPAVRIQGINTTVFDYAQMKQDAQKPDSLFNRTLKAIEQVDPAQLQGTDVAKAFWINAYNFAAMRLVTDYYPVDSIRSLSISLTKYPWSKKAIRIGSHRYSLKQIEKEILLKQFKDPRIVFAVSCAAVSCPDIPSEPFDSERLGSQLDATIRRFFANPDKGLRLDRSRRTLTLSWIMKKDSRLFQDKQKGVLGFVLPYLDPDVRGWLNSNTVTINYFKHDWVLNDLAQAD